MISYEIFETVILQFVDKVIERVMREEDEDLRDVAINYGIQDTLRLLRYSEANRIVDKMVEAGFTENRSTRISEEDWVCFFDAYVKDQPSDLSSVINTIRQDAEMPSVMLSVTSLYLKEFIDHDEYIEYLWSHFLNNFVRTKYCLRVLRKSEHEEHPVEVCALIRAYVGIMGSLGEMLGGFDE